MKSSFAPPDIMAQTAMSNYDPNFLFLVSNDASKPMMDRVKGLIVFA